MNGKKVRVEIFVPDGACGCTFSHWIDRVYKVIMNYREQVDYESFTTASERAREMGINSQCVMVNERTVNVIKLDQAIKNAITANS